MRACCSSDAAGTYISAGLPEISGTFDLDDNQAPTATGAFFNSGSAGTGFSVNADSKGKEVQFNASRVNSLYGKSDTVTPNSVNINIIIYLGK